MKNSCYGYYGKHNIHFSYRNIGDGVSSNISSASAGTMFRDVLSCIKNSGNGFYGKHNAYKVNLLLQLFLFQLFVLWLHICQRRIKNPSNI